jgi:hypothetical protein
MQHHALARLTCSPAFHVVPGVSPFACCMLYLAIILQQTLIAFGK